MDIEQCETCGFEWEGLDDSHCCTSVLLRKIEALQSSTPEIQKEAATRLSLELINLCDKGHQKWVCKGEIKEELNDYIKTLAPNNSEADNK